MKISWILHLHFDYYWRITISSECMKNRPKQNIQREECEMHLHLSYFEYCIVNSIMIYQKIVCLFWAEGAVPHCICEIIDIRSFDWSRQNSPLKLIRTSKILSKSTLWVGFIFVRIQILRYQISSRDLFWKPLLILCQAWDPRSKPDISLRNRHQDIEISTCEN